MKEKINSIQVYVDKELNQKIISQSKKADLKTSVFIRQILNKHFDEVKN